MWWWSWTELCSPPYDSDSGEGKNTWVHIFDMCVHILLDTVRQWKWRSTDTSMGSRFVSSACQHNRIIAASLQPFLNTPWQHGPVTCSDHGHLNRSESITRREQVGAVVLQWFNNEASHLFVRKLKLVCSGYSEEKQLGQVYKAPLSYDKVKERVCCQSKGHAESH